MKKLRFFLLLAAMSHSYAAVNGSITFTGTIFVAPCSTGEHSMHCTGNVYSDTLPVNIDKLPASLPESVGTASIETRGHAKIITIAYI
ncbi:hypothetical protein ACOZB2_32805 [Pantoea endophytica]|uniref:Type 1 fimbrial protein n=1 Tax=Pantoea sp. BJ2 TaxID=3141322 RepID=A0AAU7TVT5_9GAMM